MAKKPLPTIGGAEPPPPAAPGKIARDGKYELTLDVYHGDCCIGPSVSSSGLRTIEAKSLAHYWWTSPFNPERKDRNETSAMILGSAAHWLLLGEAGFGQRFVMQPEEAPDAKGVLGPWHHGKKFCKEWIAEQHKAGKSVLTATDLKHVKGMAQMLARHPMIQQGLFAGEAEQSLIVKDPETGIYVKSRPDVLPAAGEIRADLKTTTDASPQACSRTLGEYGLHMQAALVCEVQERLFGWPRKDTDCWLVFIETSPPYAVAIRPIDENAIAYGRVLNRRALRKLATAIEKNEWPGYDTDHETVGLSKWLTSQYEEQIKLSLLEKPQ